MPSFSDIIKQSGKGLNKSKDIIYLLTVNLGGTLGELANGSANFANIGRDSENVFFKPKLQNTGAIHRSVEPENGQFETADLSISLANGDLEFSAWPWNYSILNKPSVLRMGFSGSNVIEYLADCTYMADCSILANGGPLGAGSPGDISVGVAYTLYKGIIKREERSNKEFRLSIGDYTNKIFKTIPPRVVKVDEFPNIGTSVMVEGTKTDHETDLVGKPIPYIYGDFTDAPLIHPLFIDTVKKRYLIADHAIGTVVKVWSGGTQVFNFTPHTVGTHTGTHIMSFIDFGTSQGTKNVYVEIKGKVDSTRFIFGTSFTEPTGDVFIQGNDGPTNSIIRIAYDYTVNYFGTQHVSVGCWINQLPKTGYAGGTIAYVGIRNRSSSTYNYGTSDSTIVGTWQWISHTIAKTGTSGYEVFFAANTMASQRVILYDGFKTNIGTYTYPSFSGEGTGFLLNADFSNWTRGTSGTSGPDNWTAGQWSGGGVEFLGLYGSGIVTNSNVVGYYGTVLTNPALILKDILTDRHLCGLSNSDIGTASFDTAEVWLNPYSFRYIMNGEVHKNSIDLIQDISVNAMSNFYFDKENQANLSVYRPAVSRTYIRKIGQNEILEDSFSITRDVRDVYNRVVVNYDYDWIKDEYRNVYETSGTSFVDQFDTVRTFTIDSPFIYTETEASYAGMKWLSKLQGGLNKINFSVPLSMLPMDIGNRLQLSHDEPPTAIGGWTDRLINVTEFEIDNQGKTINISAVDEDEVNISRRYFILGNGTAFWRSASEAQKFYGALCSAGGTFSNGDSGARLW